MLQYIPIWVDAVPTFHGLFKFKPLLPIWFQLYTHLVKKSGNAGNAPFQYHMSPDVAAIEFHPNFACWSMEFPNHWVPPPMRPTAPQPTAALGPPFRPFQPAPPVPQVPQLPQVPQVPQAVASPGTGAWDSNGLFLPILWVKKKREITPILVFVSILFVGVSEHSGCFSGCSPPKSLSLSSCLKLQVEIFEFEWINLGRCYITIYFVMILWFIKETMHRVSTMV